MCIMNTWKNNVSLQEHWHTILLLRQTWRWELAAARQMHLTQQWLSFYWSLIYHSLICSISHRSNVTMQLWDTSYKSSSRSSTNATMKTTTSNRPWRSWGDYTRRWGQRRLFGLHTLKMKPTYILYPSDAEKLHLDRKGPRQVCRLRRCREGIRREVQLRSTLQDKKMTVYYGLIYQVLIYIMFIFDWFVFFNLPHLSM